jgi:hypothetical protein
MRVVVGMDHERPVDALFVVVVMGLDDAQDRTSFF